MNIIKLSNKKIQQSAFTIDYNGPANVLYSECLISKAFNSSDMHIKEKDTNIYNFVSIWDTGATNSAISKNVIEKLGLRPTGNAQVFHANGDSIVDTYTISIFLPNNVVFPTLKVTEGIFTDFDVLIGMDVILKGDFVITNPDRKTKLSFQIPSTHNTDYESEIQEANKVPIVKEILPGRNELCPCGSGLKYKRCCVNK